MKATGMGFAFTQRIGRFVPAKTQALICHGYTVARNNRSTTRLARQIDEATADAVFGNLGNLLAFQVGCRDAAAKFRGGDMLGRWRKLRRRLKTNLLLRPDPSREFVKFELAFVP